MCPEPSILSEQKYSIEQVEDLIEIVSNNVKDKDGKCIYHSNIRMWYRGHSVAD